MRFSFRGFFKTVKSVLKNPIVFGILTGTAWGLTLNHFNGPASSSSALRGSQVKRAPCRYRGGARTAAWCSRVGQNWRGAGYWYPLVADASMCCLDILGALADFLTSVGSLFSGGVAALEGVELGILGLPELVEPELELALELLVFM